MPVGPRECLGRLLVHRKRRRNVEQRKRRHTLRVIGRQTMCDPRAPIVRGHQESLIAQATHQFDAVGGHDPLAVVRVKIGRAHV